MGNFPTPKQPSRTTGPAKQVPLKVVQPSK